MQKCVQQNTALICTFLPGMWVLNGHGTSFIKINKIFVKKKLVYYGEVLRDLCKYPVSHQTFTNSHLYIVSHPLFLLSVCSPSPNLPSFKGSLYISDISHLFVIYVANTFTQYVISLLSLLWKNIMELQFLLLLPLAIFSFSTCMVKYFTFRSLTHWEFIFVYGVKYKSKFFIKIAIQLS